MKNRVWFLVVCVFPVMYAKSYMFLSANVNQIGGFLSLAAEHNIEVVVSGLDYGWSSFEFWVGWAKRAQVNIIVDPSLFKLYNVTKTPSLYVAGRLEKLGSLGEMRLFFKNIVKTKILEYNKT